MKVTGKNIVPAVSPVERVKQAAPGSYARPGRRPPEVLMQTEAKERVDISISEGTILAVRGGRRAERRSGSRSRIYELFDDERLPFAERRRNPAQQDGMGSTVLVVRVDDGTPKPEAVGKKVYLKLG